LNSLHRLINSSMHGPCLPFYSHLYCALFDWFLRWALATLPRLAPKSWAPVIVLPPK
jgi:hypothetical protein